MTGFHVIPQDVATHAATVASIADQVSQGADAEMQGIQQADFGIVIGGILGPGVLGLATMMQQSLAQLSDSVTKTAQNLTTTADAYASGEQDTCTVVNGLTAS